VAFRDRDRWPLSLGPAHGESVVDRSPGDMNLTFIRRQRPVFSGIGGEFVEREPDGLRGSRREAPLRPMDVDPRANEVGEVRELGPNQVSDPNSMPFVADEQVLIG
jgi:hypothetical protein